MEVQIVIFLAFTGVTLVFNSLVIWFAYKAFANVTMKVTETVSELHTGEETRSWLRALETASRQAVLATETAKNQVTDFEPVLARAQSQFGYGLAKVDVRVERFCDDVRRQAARAQDAVLRPAHRFGAAVSGAQEVLEYVTAARNGDSATSTPTG